MLNRSGESGHPCLVPDLKGKAFILSPSIMMLAVGPHIYGLCMSRYVLSVPNLLRVFTMNGC